MKFVDFRELVERISWGKRVGNALYVYREGFISFGDELDALVRQVESSCGASAEHNLIKFRTDEFKLSFLSYPEFLSEPHPVLSHAITVDLITGRVRKVDYKQNLNPPILH